jgi:hypothetical protein
LADVRSAPAATSPSAAPSPIADHSSPRCALQRAIAAVVAALAGVIVIAGVAEIARVAARYGYSRFEVEATTPRSSNQPTTRTRRSAPN